MLSQGRIFVVLVASCEWVCSGLVVNYRAGTQSDELGIRKCLAMELMNPLSIKAENFEIATEERSQRTIGFGQIREMGDYYELASLYVDPSFRGQGIGSKLVERLVGRVDATSVYLLTLDETIDFYNRLGFDVTEDIPREMDFEVTAGRVITTLIGKHLVCMRASPSSRTKQ